MGSAGERIFDSAADPIPIRQLPPALPHLVATDSSHPYW
ncbi:MAG: hypothetical protein ACI8VW_001640 [bacterium]|jgi:hypothetical protein